MKIFVCNRSKDKEIAENVIKNLVEEAKNTIAIFQETEFSEHWQNNVKKKMQESDFIMFLLGVDTFESEQIKWEYKKAKELNKQIVGFKLNDEDFGQSILSLQGFQVFNNPKHCIEFLNKTYTEFRNLNLEQYRIMVGSTEKVTENRMKVNNLFFTITSSILSVGFVLGKTFGFSIKAMLGMLTLTILALILTYYWERLINSYALLNQGKFMIINKIEKQLRTNMFEDEWNILTQEIKYKPNSKTETLIIKSFRIFIYIIGAIELLYIYYLIYKVS